MFDGTSTKSCTLDVDPTIQSLDMQAGYAGGGGLQAGARTLTVTGNFTIANTAGLFVKGTSTVDLTGTGNLANPQFSNNFYKLKLAAAGQITTMTDSFRGRNLELGTGTLNRTAGSIIVGDSATTEQILINAGATVTGSPQWTFSTTAGNVATLDGGDLGGGNANFTGTNPTVILRLLGNLTVGRFDMTGSATFDANGFDLTVVNQLNVGFSTGTPTFNAGLGTIDANNFFLETAGGAPTINLDSSSFICRGNWLVQAGGTVNPGTSTVTFTRVGGTSSITSVGQPFANVVFDDGGTGVSFTLNDDMRATDDVTFTSLTNLNGNTFFIEGDLFSTDTAVGGTTALTLDGALDQTITTGAGDLPDGAFTVDKAAGTAFLADALSLNAAGQNLAIDQGTLDLNGNDLTVNGTTSVQNGGTLSGSGTVNGTVSVQPGGAVAPGSAGPGILGSADTTFAAGATFDIELNGTTAGTEYDRLDVAGTVDVTGATLSVTLGFTPTSGDTFTIANNDAADAVTGTFNGLAEGATFVTGGETFRITYVGGDGNDIVLTSLQADLSITKDDGVATVTPGGGVTYTIVVTNGGPFDDPSVSVADTFPASLLNVAYTSVAAGGATGNTASGLGDLADTLDMPAGSSVTYTATADVDPAATGTLSNTATVTGSFDPDASNNTATDDDALVAGADLLVTKSVSNPTPSNGGTVTYTIVIQNLGPSDADNVMLVDDLGGSGLAIVASFSTVTQGSFDEGTATWDLVTPLVAGGSATLTYDAIVDFASGGTSITNTALATASSTDLNLGNNEASATVLAAGESIKIERASFQLHYNKRLVGNDPVDSYTVAGRLNLAALVAQGIDLFQLGGYTVNFEFAYDDAFPDPEQGVTLAVPLRVTPSTVVWKTGRGAKPSVTFTLNKYTGAFTAIVNYIPLQDVMENFSTPPAPLKRGVSSRVGSILNDPTTAPPFVYAVPMRIGIGADPSVTPLVFQGTTALTEMEYSIRKPNTVGRGTFIFGRKGTPPQPLAFIDSARLVQRKLPGNVYESQLRATLCLVPDPGNTGADPYDPSAGGSTMDITLGSGGVQSLTSGNFIARNGNFTARSPTAGLSSAMYNNTTYKLVIVSTWGDPLASFGVDTIMDAKGDIPLGRLAIFFPIQVTLDGADAHFATTILGRRGTTFMTGVPTVVFATAP
ncbi:MAG: hypothetical protein M5U26_27740 [Planctomycetota bacterium]|nr:hypothetical protein [Planctomycetota bacterium]